MKNKTIKNIILLVSLTSLPILALADISIPQPITTIWSLNSVVHILNVAINWLFAILMVVAVIYILLAAFSYLSSAGDPEKVKGAQSRLIYAAVAIGVGLIAESIMWVVSSFLSS